MVKGKDETGVVRPSPSRGLRESSARSAVTRTRPRSMGLVRIQAPLRLLTVLVVCARAATRRPVVAGTLLPTTTSCSREAVMTRHRGLESSSARRPPTVFVRRQLMVRSPSSRRMVVIRTSTSVAMRQMEEKRTAGRAPTPRTPSRARSASRATTLPPLLPSPVRSASSPTVYPVQTARTSARPASTASRGYGCDRAGLWGRGGPNEHPEESCGPPVLGAGRW
ncbi:hypothetical protein GMRT_20002 [Giardia muris]|uniref:Uncharacterized protein n=1 Tax=Giardia muris TaxID=5742 RepID=A0A4Z1SRB2_GIAMU|nr:hypothetical protein GMRT_25098 [Giardia muris]TNJ29242.1 hypothetical protein GMRT_20002 [Giardia muris]|eukprot:TNJ26148.1 hypothetical protein GMRT_25098 [Giardia muris]